MPYCRECGAEVPPEGRYCPECGVRATPSTESRSTATAGSISDLAGRTAVNALVGGTVGFLIAVLIGTIFTPLYLLGVMTGAGLAGYLQRGGTGEGAKVGGLAAVVATAPVVLLIIPLSVLGIGTVIGWAPLGLNTGGGWIVILALAGLVMILSFATNVVFGLLGGIVGAALAEEASA